MQFAFRPYFNLDDIPGYERPEAVALTERWIALFGLDREALKHKADPEEWIESAMLLFAAIDNGYPVIVIDREQDYGTIARFNGAGDLEDGKIVLIGGDTRYPELAREKKSDFAFPKGPGLNRAMRFQTLEAFKANAGRRILSTDLAHLQDAMVELAAEGPSRIRVKPQLPPKRAAPEVFDVAPSLTADQVYSQLVERYQYDLLSFEDIEDAFIVQDEITMRGEYRIAVIGHRLVAGAGCIEALTPLDHIGSLVLPGFDIKLEGKRGAGDVHEDLETVCRYVHDAHRIVREIAAEAPEMIAYTLDLATDAHGKTVIVEINPGKNFGLYAMDVARLVSAYARLGAPVAAQIEEYAA